MENEKKTPLFFCCKLFEKYEKTNVALFCQLLGVEGSALSEALTHKKIVAKGEEVNRSSSPI